MRLDEFGGGDASYSPTGADRSLRAEVAEAPVTDLPANVERMDAAPAIQESDDVSLGTGVDAGAEDREHAIVTTEIEHEPARQPEMERMASETTPADDPEVSSPTNESVATADFAPPREDFDRSIGEGTYTGPFGDEPGMEGIEPEASEEPIREVAANIDSWPGAEPTDEGLSDGNTDQGGYVERFHDDVPATDAVDPDPVDRLSDDRPTSDDDGLSTDDPLAPSRYATTGLEDRPYPPIRIGDDIAQNDAPITGVPGSDRPEVPVAPPDAPTSTPDAPVQPGGHGGDVPPDAPLTPDVPVPVRDAPIAPEPASLRDDASPLDNSAETDARLTPDVDPGPSEPAIPEPEPTPDVPSTLKETSDPAEGDPRLNPETEDVSVPRDV